MSKAVTAGPTYNHEDKQAPLAQLCVQRRLIWLLELGASPLR